MNILFTVLSFLTISLNANASVHWGNTNLKQLRIVPDTSYSTVRVLLFPISKSEPQKYQRSNVASLNSCKKNAGSSFTYEAVGYGEEIYLAEASTGKVINKGYKIDIDFCRKVVTVTSASILEGLTHDFSNDSLLDFFIAVPPTIKTKIIGPGILRNQAYPGSFRIQAVRNGSGKVVEASMVNYVHMEDYVKGVLPIEMGEEFGDDARKTQTVACRTYGLRDLLVSRCDSRYTGPRCVPRAFDVFPTTQDQVYGGTIRQTERSNNLVDATKGEIVVKKDKAGEFVVQNTEYSPRGQGSRMSQTAAGHLDRRGVDYKKILAQEYPGTTLVSMSDVFSSGLAPETQNGFWVQIDNNSLADF